MFDLERSVAEWKRSFQERGSLVDDSIEELESHLREAMIDFRRRGLSEEESFLIAAKRLGHPGVLGAEFEKNGFLGAKHERLAWMLSGYLGVSLCGICATALVSALTAGMAYVGAGATTTGIAATFLQVTLWIALVSVALRIAQAPFVLGKFPTFSLMALFLAMIVLPFVRPLANAAQARLVEPSWLVETYYWVGFGQFAIQLIVYTFCFVALYRVSKSRKLIAQ